jgi:hypothetical protein
MMVGAIRAFTIGGVRRVARASACAAVFRARGVEFVTVSGAVDSASLGPWVEASPRSRQRRAPTRLAMARCTQYTSGAFTIFQCVACRLLQDELEVEKALERELQLALQTEEMDGI